MLRFVTRLACHQSAIEGIFQYVIDQTPDDQAMNRTQVFVDADNQPPALGGVLSRFLGTIDRAGGHVLISGNGSGDRIQHWEHALRNGNTDFAIDCHRAPLRKQSADVRLMFELAAFYHGQPDPDALIVIVSRDELLLAAAESLAERGHRTMVVIAASPNAHPVISDVPVVVLPLPQAAAPSHPAVSAKPAASTEGPASQIVAEAIARIRKSLKPNADGGYAASAVGQVLAQMGHDKATRALIVRGIPNLREVGAGSEKRLVF